MIRDIRAVIDQMSPEELAEERRRMRARCARERARGSEGVRMLTYRLRMVEARMQQIAVEAAQTDAGGDRQAMSGKGHDHRTAGADRSGLYGWRALV